MAATDASPTFETNNAQVFELHRVKDFDAENRVRKRLFETDQLRVEIACYEAGQSTVMHKHPYEEEALFVLQGTAQMNIDGEEVELPSGAIVRFPKNVMQDVRNPHNERCVIMFIKIANQLARSMV